MKYKTNKKRIRSIRYNKKKIDKKTEHHLYIASEAWKQRRKKYFSEHRNVCAACEFAFGLVLHHKSYAVLGGLEPDENLIILCSGCHESLHKMYGNKDLFINTELYIKNYKQLL